MKQGANDPIVMLNYFTITLFSIKSKIEDAINKKPT